MTSEEQCLNVEEHLVVDSEVLVHGGDFIQPSSSDAGLLVPLSSSSAASVSAVQTTTDQQSVAVVEAGPAAAAKAFMWAYGRPAFYVSPAAVLSNVPTAVVAPIKREIPESVPSSTLPQSALQSLQGNAFEQSVPTNAVQTPATTPPPPPLSKAHLPPFETFRAHAISGGSTSMTSASVTSSESDASLSAVNLCLATRAASKPDAAEVSRATEALPLTSLHRHTPTSSSSAFPFPVWSLPTVALAADVGGQLRRAADPQSSTTDLLVTTNDGHVTEQSLPVQQAPPITVAQAITSTSMCVVSNAGNVYN